MAKFTNKPPDWTATGVEPTDEMKSKGFSAGYKPPAAFFNWFWTKVSTCIKELFDRSAGVVQNENGGEVFNDYNGNVASGKLSHSEGLETTSSGNYSHSEGHLSKSSGAVSHAEGYNTNASGEYCHAEGNATTASGICCHTEGHKTTASAYYAHAEGMNTTAMGNYSHAQNYSTNKAGDIVDLANATNEEIIEAWKSSDNKFSLAKTDFCNVSGRNCLALEIGANATGKDCIASGTYATTEGNLNIASGNYSHAEGSENKATGVYSHCENIQNEASGDASHAEGGVTKAKGNYAHSQGFGTRALGANSAANGARTTALGAYATSNGFATNIATDIIPDLSVEKTNASIIEAWKTSKFSLAKGIYSKVDGNNCLALNNGAEASGEKTIASGANAKSSGIETVASGSYSEAGNVYCVSAGYAATSHGGKTVAVGDYAVSDGLSANVATEVLPDVNKDTPNDTIVEAWKTTKFSLAKGGYSKVSGNNCLALGAGSFARGKDNIARGNYSTAEGSNTTASAESTHAEGYSTVASGSNSHAEGQETTASGTNSHSEGANTVASGQFAHAQGYLTEASGSGSHAEGSNTVASGGWSHAGGYQTTAFGSKSVAIGSSSNKATDVVSNLSDETELDDITNGWSSNKFSLAKGENSYVKGIDCIALGNNSEANGYETIAQGDASHAEGMKTSAIGVASYAIGVNTIADGMCSFAGGCNTYAKGFGQSVFGKFNIKGTDFASTAGDTRGSSFIVGCGTDNSARANALRISNDGKCYGQNAFLASGADYAEFYEWQDGNPKNEDRRGCFVTLDGNKIRKANAEDDYILGVISATPCVVGNTYSDMWQGMYLTDVFGERLTEVVEVPEITDEETGIVIPAHTETRFVINPEYDPTKDYAGRNERKEWATVGTHGQLVVIDDGTCQINSYCKVVDGGTVTASETVTDYRVIERLDDTHIRIVIK